MAESLAVTMKKATRQVNKYLRCSIASMAM